MMEQPDTGALAAPPFHWKALPLLTVLALEIAIPLLATLTVDIVEHVIRLPERPPMPWIRGIYDTVALAAYTVGVLRLVQKHQPADYGVRWPGGRSYVAEAIGAGLLLGVVAALVDYGPQILRHLPPQRTEFPLTGLNVIGWLSYQALFAAPADELLFRGLLVTYLTQAMPGRLAWRGYEMNGAGVAVAALFAFAELGNDLKFPLVSVLGQMLYTFAFGVLFAFWYERSRSLLAPVIGHAALGVAKFAVLFAMVARWG